MAKSHRQFISKIAAASMFIMPGTAFAGGSYDQQPRSPSPPSTYNAGGQGGNGYGGSAYSGSSANAAAVGINRNNNEAYGGNARATGGTGIGVGQGGSSSSNASSAGGSNDLNVRVFGLPPATGTNLPSFGLTQCEDIKAHSNGGVSVGAVFAGIAGNFGGSERVTTNMDCVRANNETAVTIQRLNTIGQLGANNNCVTNRTALYVAMDKDQRDIVGTLEQFTASCHAVVSHRHAAPRPVQPHCCACPNVTNNFYLNTGKSHGDGAGNSGVVIANAGKHCPTP